MDWLETEQVGLLAVCLLVTAASPFAAPQVARVRSFRSPQSLVCVHLVTFCTRSVLFWLLCIRSASASPASAPASLRTHTGMLLLSLGTCLFVSGICALGLSGTCYGDHVGILEHYQHNPTSQRQQRACTAQLLIPPHTRHIAAHFASAAFCLVRCVSQPSAFDEHGAPATRSGQREQYLSIRSSLNHNQSRVSSGWSLSSNGTEAEQTSSAEPSCSGTAIRFAGHSSEDCGSAYNSSDARSYIPGAMRRITDA